MTLSEGKQEIKTQAQLISTCRFELIFAVYFCSLLLIIIIGLRLACLTNFSRCKLNIAGSKAVLHVSGIINAAISIIIVIYALGCRHALVQ
jgi:hypothetical protein